MSASANGGGNNAPSADSGEVSGGRGTRRSRRGRGRGRGGNSGGGEGGNGGVSLPPDTSGGQPAPSSNPVPVMRGGLSVGRGRGNDGRGGANGSVGFGINGVGGRGRGRQVPGQPVIAPVVGPGSAGNGSGGRVSGGDERARVNGTDRNRGNGTRGGGNQGANRGGVALPPSPVLSRPLMFPHALYVNEGRHGGPPLVFYPALGGQQQQHQQQQHQQQQHQQQQQNGHGQGYPQDGLGQSGRAGGYNGARGGVRGGEYPADQEAQTPPNHNPNASLSEMAMKAAQHTSHVESLPPEARAAAREAAAHKQSGGAIPIIRPIPPNGRSAGGNDMQFYYPVGLHGRQMGKLQSTQTHDRSLALPQTPNPSPAAAETPRAASTNNDTDQVEPSKSKKKREKKKNKKLQEERLNERRPEPDNTKNWPSPTPSTVGESGPEPEKLRTEEPEGSTKKQVYFEEVDMSLRKPPPVVATRLAKITPEIYDGLRELVHPPATLKNYGYTIANPTREEIESELSKMTGKAFCRRCREEFEVREIASDRISVDPCRHHTGKCDVPVEGRRTAQGRQLKVWSCCKERGFAPGCSKSKTHVVEMENAPLLANLCPFLPTPAALPDYQKSSEIQKIISLDCEMCYTKYGLALARMTILSFPAATILADIFVVEPYPGVGILDYNTEFSGITKDDLYPKNPLSKPPVLRGIEAARAKLWEYCDADTIIVGHGLDHDMKCLRVLHPRIVDTAILWSPAVGTKFRLKKLAETHLGWAIQTNSGRGGGAGAGAVGHDSIEDCRASMELALEFMRRPKVPEASAASETPD